MVVGHVVELVHYAVVSVMNSMVITDWLKLQVKTETRLPVVVNPVVTLIKQHQRLHVALGTGKRIMKREFDRYVVLKWSDVIKCLNQEEQKQLVALGHKFQQYRRDTSRPWECIVIEHDWPEYEPVWQAIEQRVDGPKQLPPMNKSVTTLANEVSKSVLTDEISEGCDISAGMFGPVFSQLIFRLAVAQQKAELFDKLVNLMGYVQNGTDQSIKIFQDDATFSYFVAGGTNGRYTWDEFGSSLEEAIEKAHQKHGDPS